MNDASPNLNFMKLALWVKNKGIVVDFKTFFVIAWSLWGRQNKSLYEQLNESPTSTIEGALDFTSIYLNCSKAPRSELKHISKWQPPPSSYFKLNVDGTLFFDQLKTIWEN